MAANALGITPPRQLTVRSDITRTIRDPRRMSRSLCTLAFLWLAGVALWAAPAQASPLEITSSPVELDDRGANRQSLGPLTYLGGIRLRSQNRLFGGLSGLEIMDGGRSIVAVSDRGFWFSADIAFGDGGRPLALVNADLTRIRGQDGTMLGRRYLQDAEALARDGDDFLVAFEGFHRIRRYPVGLGPEAAATAITGIPGIGDMPSNGGIEALAVLGPGRLLAISEDGRTSEGDLQGWIVDGDNRYSVSYVTEGSFKPTDLALLPSGDLLVLERRFSALGGFGARLRLVDKENIRPGERLTAREIVRFRTPLVDNLEGLAVTQSGGRTLVYIVSDDNFSTFQRNLLLLFELDEEKLVRP